jgi:hydroxyacylglutathione hydrolase
MHVETIETPGLGNRCYVLVSDGAAMVVDPPRDIDRIDARLGALDASLALVVETHRHADYVSGGLQLSRAHRATYAVPGGEPAPRFPHERVVDDSTYTIGNVTLRAVHTPGHTPNHMSYVAVDDTGTTAAFTGGGLLHAGVGRTDLIRPLMTGALARAQWRSARRLADTLPAEAVVLPTHGFGSLCAASASASPGKLPATPDRPVTIGVVRQANDVFTMAEEDFVTRLLDGYDPFPAYYARLPLINAAGPQPIDLGPTPSADRTELRRRLDAGEWLVDLRPRRDFAAGHLVGSLSFDVTGNLATYLGWLLPPGTPVTLLADTPDQVTASQRVLARVGIDRPAAVAVGGLATWTGTSADVRSFPVTDLDGLARAATMSAITVLDVRSRNERRLGSVADSLHIPLEDVESRLVELADHVLTREPLWVHCASGFRAGIAASILDAHDIPVVFVDDDFNAARWEELTRGAASLPDVLRLDRPAARADRAGDAQPSGTDERDGVRRHGAVAGGAGGAQP